VKRLTLIRHANADWKNVERADFDRPLSKRGLNEADALGQRLLEEKLIPELLIASSALRTQQTCEILGRRLGLIARRVKATEKLYLARADDILALARATGPRVQHLAIVAHNPGLTELARLLAPEDARIGELGTAYACTLTFNVRTWSAIAAPAARALVLEPPAKLFSFF
jgi:phosphohistidine phosphatase